MACSDFVHLIHLQKFLFYYCSLLVLYHITFNSCGNVEYCFREFKVIKLNNFIYRKLLNINDTFNLLISLRVKEYKKTQIQIMNIIENIIKNTIYNFLTFFEIMIINIIIELSIQK